MPSKRGLGAIVAAKFAAEGSNIAINYMSSKETAEKVASDIASKYNVKTVVIQGVGLPVLASSCRIVLIRCL